MDAIDQALLAALAIIVCAAVYGCVWLLIQLVRQGNAEHKRRERELEEWRTREYQSLDWKASVRDSQRTLQSILQRHKGDQQ